MVANRTIVVSEDTYNRLKAMKIVDREPFNDVIKRLLEKP